MHNRKALCWLALHLPSCQVGSKVCLDMPSQKEGTPLKADPSSPSHFLLFRPSPGSQLPLSFSKEQVIRGHHSSSEASPRFCAVFSPRSARGVSTQLLVQGIPRQRCAWPLCLLVAVLGTGIVPSVRESLLLSVSTPGHTPPPWPFAVVTMESAPVPFFLGSTNGPLSFFNVSLEFCLLH